jgi:cell division protein FtsQ
MKQAFHTRILSGMRFLTLAVVLLVLGWGSYTLVQYLRTAPRFVVQKVSVSGLRHVKENQVLAMARFELGTNVFAADLDEIRQRVEQLQWVRFALVQRVLPDQVMVRVIERVPIGTARIRGEVFQFDDEAAILDPDPVNIPNGPILDGLRPGGARNLEKVKAYQKVVEELGQTELSEVHVNDAGEVSVVSATDPLLISLGKSEFRDRWISYLRLKTQIHERYPLAVRVDLRFRNQVIIRMREDDTGEKIVWDAEKKTL